MVTIRTWHKKCFRIPLESLFPASTPAASTLRDPTHLTLPASPFTRNYLQFPCTLSSVTTVSSAWKPFFHLVLLAFLFIQHIAQQVLRLTGYQALSLAPGETVQVQKGSQPTAPPLCISPQEGRNNTQVIKSTRYIKLVPEFTSLTSSSRVEGFLF